MTREHTQKPFPWPCPACMKREVRPATIANYRAKMKYNGHAYEFLVDSLPVARCAACGEVVFTADSEDQITRALREKLGLLHPEEIRRIRGTRSQAELAELLCTAPETISRWETGAVIQSRAMNKALLDLTDRPAATTVFDPSHLPADWALEWAWGLNSCGTDFAFNWTDLGAATVEVHTQQGPASEGDCRIAA